MASEGSIEIFVGEVGSGKSYMAVGHRILPHLAVGGVVCTNIPVCLDSWYSSRYDKTYKGARQVLRERFGWELQDGQLLQLPKDCWENLHNLIPAGTSSLPVLVVLDEVLEGFDSLDRDKNKSSLKDVLSFIRHCRKLNVNLVLILQTFAELNNRIRSKATRIWLLRDTNKMRVPVVRLPYPIRNHILMQWFNSKGTEIYWQKHIHKGLWVYSCYDTGDMSLTDIRCGLGIHEGYKGKGKVKGTKTMKLYQIMLLVLALGLGAFSLGHIGRIKMAQEKIVLLSSRIESLEKKAAMDSGVVEIATDTKGKEGESEVLTLTGLWVTNDGEGAVGLSNGRTVHVGRSCDWGKLIDVDVNSGVTYWDKAGVVTSRRM